MKRMAWLIVLLLAAGCATVPITGRNQLSLVPYSRLAVLSEDNYRQLLKDSKLSDDLEKTKMVIRVGERIALSTEAFMRENGMERELKRYNWEFNLIEDDEIINAFVMPGGKIGVYTGMLPVTQDENGLATVLAHEVAHALANHGGERLSQLLLVNLAGIGLAAALREEKKKTRRLWMAAYGIGAEVGVLLPYSRTHESEADHIGLIIMARAGYDPRAAIPFWERMNKQKEYRPPEFLSTHPAPRKRMEAIRSEVPEAMKYYKK